MPLLSENRSSSTPATQGNNSSVHDPVDSLGRQNLATAIDQHGSGRRSLSESLRPNQGNVSLRKQLHNEEDRVVVKITKKSEDDNSMQVSRTPR